MQNKVTTNGRNDKGVWALWFVRLSRHLKDHTTMSSPQLTLNDLRKHPKFPFNAWQEDDVSFLMLQRYWAELVRVMLGDEMANYTPLWETARDANPILTITNQTARRGLRLIMIENEEDKPAYPEKVGPGAFYSLYPFMNDSFLPDGQTPVWELGMFLKLDERYASYFEHLVRLHCCDYVSVEQMEKEIANYEAKFSMTDPMGDGSDD